MDAQSLLSEQGWPRERLAVPDPGPNPVRDVVLGMRWDLLRRLRCEPVQRFTEPVPWYAEQREGLRAHGRGVYDAFRRCLFDRVAG